MMKLNQPNEYYFTGSLYIFIFNNYITKSNIILNII